MSPIAPLAPTRAWVRLPRLSLASCVRAFLFRDTRGADLGALQRFNHFPASPFCAISWWFSGSSDWLGAGTCADLAQPRQPLPATVLFSGPFTQPTTSWCPGPVHGMMLMLLPDAVHTLTGIQPQHWVNRFATVPSLFDTDWQALCADVLAAPDDSVRQQQIEDFLEPRWQARRHRQPLQGHRMADWAQGLALRAATSAPGRSLRQVERRIKQWAGLPLRELQGLTRAERAFFQVVAAQRHGPVNWTQMAVDAGYADQSHLCRASRRVTGFAPEELRRLIETDERFWAYRAWE